MNTVTAPTAPVVPAYADELPRLAHVLTAAFATDPVSDWLFDGDQDACHPAFFGAFLRLAFGAGRVDQTVDGTAVAVWVDNTRPPDAAVRQDFQCRLDEAVAGHRVRWQALDAAMWSAHPTGPHWWLAFIGVLPGQHRRGQARRLLEHAAARLGGHEAYLEATSRRLVAYYARHGYVPAGEIAVERGPRLHPMCRPRTGRP